MARRLSGWLQAGSALLNAALGLGLLALAACSSEIGDDIMRQADTGTVYLNSTGGNAAQGFKIAAYLENLRIQGHAITTVIDGKCDSMCVPIFMQGTRRIAAPGSTVTFHSIGIRLSPTERFTVPDATARMLRILRDRGIDPYFLARLWGQNVFVDGNVAAKFMAKDVPGLLSP